MHIVIPEKFSRLCRERSNLDSFNAKRTRVKKCQQVYSLLYAQVSSGICTGQGYCSPTICSSRRITSHQANKYLLDFESIYRGADTSLAPDQEGKKLQRQKILIVIYPINYHNWRNISTIYIYNKTSIKQNILTIKQYISGSRSG